jgi:hypothetical protein
LVARWRELAGIGWNWLELAGVGENWQGLGGPRSIAGESPSVESVGQYRQASGRPARSAADRARVQVERFCNKIKTSRRSASRNDKLADDYLAFIKPASIRIWLRARACTP